MKLSEFKYFPAFLSDLFSFFKEYRIPSSLDAIDSFDNMRDRLLGADFVAFTYLSNINKYSLQIMFNTAPEKEEVYSFLWGKADSKRVNELLIDIGENLVFLNIELVSEKYPVFVRDFLTDDGELRASCFGEEDAMICLDDASIMSMDEFRAFLSANNAPKDCTIVEVD